MEAIKRLLRRTPSGAVSERYFPGFRAFPAKFGRFWASRPARYTRYGFYGLAALILIPYLILVLINLIDESPAPGFVEFTTHIPNPINDKDNAVYALYGLGAPADVKDFHAWGYARAQRDLKALRDAEEYHDYSDIRDEPVPLAWKYDTTPRKQRMVNSKLCKPGDILCLKHILKFKQENENELHANKLRMARYYKVLGYTAYFEADANERIMFRDIFRPYTPEQHAEWVRIKILVAEGKTTEALRGIERSMRFLRIQHHGLNEEMNKGSVRRKINEYLTLTSAIIRKQRLSATQYQIARRILRPMNAAELDYSTMTQATFASFMREHGDDLSGGPSEFRVPWSYFIVRPFLVDQQTANVYYRHEQFRSRMAKTDIKLLLPILKEYYAGEYKNIPEVYEKPSDWALVRFIKRNLGWLRNPVGKYMIGYQPGTTRWMLEGKLKAHALDLRFRLVAQQLALRQAGVPYARIGKHLSKKYAHPVTGALPRWDAKQRILWHSGYLDGKNSLTRLHSLWNKDAGIQL